MDKRIIKNLEENGIKYTPFMRSSARNQINKKMLEYGSSIGEYDLLLKEQNNKCYICSRVSENNKRLSIDHCHTTGLFRGLICNRCNLGLWCFGDDIILMKKAINYIKEFEDKINTK